MSFEEDGFFSPEIELFRRNVRNEGDTKLWFDYALELNRTCFDLLREAQTPKAQNAEFTKHGLFVRAHQSIQAALILAERGLIGDARTVLRSATEGVIAIYAITADPDFVQRLIDAHHVNQRKVARLVRSNPNYAATCSAEDIADMDKVIVDVNAIESARGSKLQDINWADAALKHCPDLYDLLYRTLSTDGTHTTLTSLDRYVIADANMEITAFKVAPDGDGLIEVLSAACLLFLWALDPMAAAFNRPDITDQIKRQVQRFGTLPGALPAKLTPRAGSIS
jgi:Family of unknown function (DUF5677)